MSEAMREHIEGLKTEIKKEFERRMDLVDQLATSLLNGASQEVTTTALAPIHVTFERVGTTDAVRNVLKEHEGPLNRSQITELAEPLITKHPADLNAAVGAAIHNMKKKGEITEVEPRVYQYGSQEEQLMTPSGVPEQAHVPWDDE